MQDEINDGDQEHQERIEYEQHPFVRDNVSIISLSVLDHANDVTRQDESTAEVHSVHVLAPAQSRVDRGPSRKSVDANMEETGDNNKETKDEDLYDESANDNILSQVERVEISCGLYSSTARLYEEGDHVANDEDLGEPFGTDDCVLFGVKASDDTTKDHVDRGSIERRGDQK